MCINFFLHIFEPISLRSTVIYLLDLIHIANTNLNGTHPGKMDPRPPNEILWMSCPGNRKWAVKRRSRKVDKAFSGKVMDTFVVRLIFRVYGGHMFALEIRLSRVQLLMVSRLRRSA